MWASVKGRRSKGLCLKMFRTEHKGVRQHFYIGPVGYVTLAVFVVSVLFSFTLIFSPYIRPVFVL